MPKLVKNGSVVENAWLTLDKEDESTSFDENSLIPLKAYLANAESLQDRTDIGVWIDSDETPEALEPYVKNLSVIAVNFPKFIDGRGYSIARILKDRLNYEGELRAIGDVLHDQLFYMKRCGFNAFAIREDKDAEVAMNGLSDFTETYQCAADEPRPLFRRR